MNPSIYDKLSTAQKQLPNSTLRDCISAGYLTKAECEWLVDRDIKISNILNNNRKVRSGWGAPLLFGYLIGIL